MRSPELHAQTTVPMSPTYKEHSEPEPSVSTLPPLSYGKRYDSEESEGSDIEYGDFETSFVQSNEPRAETPAIESSPEPSPTVSPTPRYPRRERHPAGFYQEASSSDGSSREPSPAPAPRPAPTPWTNTPSPPRSGNTTCSEEGHSDHEVSIYETPLSPLREFASGVFRQASRVLDPRPPAPDAFRLASTSTPEHPGRMLGNSLYACALRLIMY